MGEVKLIYSFPKNPLEEIRCSVNVFKGREYADLRLYYRNNTGQWKPTRKGLTISADCIEDLVLAVSKLAQYLEVGPKQKRPWQRRSGALE